MVEKFIFYYIIHTIFNKKKVYILSQYCLLNISLKNEQIKNIQFGTHGVEKEILIT